MNDSLKTLAFVLFIIFCVSVPVTLIWIGFVLARLVKHKMRNRDYRDYDCDDDNDTRPVPSPNP